MQMKFRIIRFIKNANEVQIEGVQTSAAAGSELLHTELMTKDIPDSLPQFGEPPISWDKDGQGNDPVKHLKVQPFRIHQLNFGAGSCRVNDFRISPTCIQRISFAFIMKLK